MSLHKSVTVSILKKFNEDELNKLSSFINFSVGEKNNTLKNAFAFLKSCAPEYDAKTCTKENFSKKGFNKKLNEKLDKEINRLMSELKDEIDKFIIYNYAVSNENIRYQSLLLWFHSNNMVVFEEKILKEMEHSVLQNKAHDFREIYKDYLTYKFNLAQRLDNYSTTFELLEHYIDFINNKFEIERFESITTYENFKNNFPEKSIAAIKKNPSDKFLKLDFKAESKVFEAMSKMTIAPNIELYNFLKQAVFNEKLMLSNEDKSETLTLLKNSLKHLSKDLNLGNERLDLSEMQMKMNEIMYDGNVSFMLLDYDISELISHNRIDEAKTKINRYKNKIIGIKDWGNLNAIYQAFFLQKENKFPEALKIINSCHSENRIQQRDILYMKVKLAYEIKEPRLFDSYVNNIRKYFSTKAGKQFNETSINQYLAVVKYLSKLFHIKEKDFDNLTALRTKAISDNKLYDKKYVLEKIEEKLKEKAI